MLVCKNAKICVTPDAKPKICDTPNTKPQSQSVEYRLRLACTFHIVCVNFVRVGHLTQTSFPVEYGLKRSKTKVGNSGHLHNEVLHIFKDRQQKVKVVLVASRYIGD